MSSSNVPIGKWLGEGFELYKNNFGLVFVASLVGILISVVSIGILSGAMLAGIYTILFRLLDPQQTRPAFDDVFKRFDKLLPGLGAILIIVVISFVGQNLLGFVPGLGGILGFLFSAAVTACTLFVFPLLVDKDSTIVDAFTNSFDKVKDNLVMFALFALVLQILSFLGVFLFFVGVFVTAPLVFCCTAVAYKDVFYGARDAVAPTTATPPTSPSSGSGMEVPPTMSDATTATDGTTPEDDRFRNRFQS